jgi:hypothetical protein
MAWKLEDGKQYNISNKNGDEFWYLNNKLHREKGPAIILQNGAQVWYYEGTKMVCCSQKEFEQLIGLKKTAQQMQQYDVKIETMVPAELTFRVTAKSPEEAVQKAKLAQPRNVQYKMPARKDRKASVYDAGMSIIRLVKNLVG